MSAQGSPATDHFSSNPIGVSPTQSVEHVQTPRGVTDASQLEAGIATVGTGDTQGSQIERLATRETEHKMSQGRKWFLLLVFSVAQVSRASERAARAHIPST